MASPKPRTPGLVYGPTGKPSGARARPVPAYLGPPKPKPITPTAARTLLPGQPGAVPGAYAPNVAVRPRWAGSHWATGRKPARTLGRKAQPVALPPEEVAKRIKYGY